MVVKYSYIKCWKGRTKIPPMTRESRVLRRLLTAPFYHGSHAESSSVAATVDRVEHFEMTSRPVRSQIHICILKVQLFGLNICFSLFQAHSTLWKLSLIYKLKHNSVCERMDVVYCC